jgi:hypothetical protein
MKTKELKRWGIGATFFVNGADTKTKDELVETLRNLNIDVNIDVEEDEDEFCINVDAEVNAYSYEDAKDTFESIINGATTIIYDYHYIKELYTL